MDLIDEYGVNKTIQMINDAMEEVFGAKLPQDVLDKIVRYEKLRFTLKEKWKNTDGFLECYLSSLLWNRLTPDKQEQVLQIMATDADSGDNQ